MMKKNETNSTPENEALQKEKTVKTKETKPTKKEKSKEPREKKSKASGSYVTGIIGAIVGGIIATIPWVLMYVYGNMMLSALAILIAAGELLGYKLLKGKMTKAVPIIIMAIAIVIVSVTTLLVIPSVLLYNEGVVVSVNTLKVLYADSEFTGAITQDFILAVVFTILGASVITANIKKQIAEGTAGRLEDFSKEELEEKKNLAIQKIKPIFEKFNATTKEHRISKQELFAEFEESEELKASFNFLKSIKIINKEKGKYYFSEEVAEKPIEIKKSKKTHIIIACALVIIIALGVGIGIATNKGLLGNNEVITDGMLSFEINKSWTAYSNYYNSGWSYYKFINSVPLADDANVNEIAYDEYPAYLNVSYYEITAEDISSIEDVQKNMKEYAESMEEPPAEYKDEIVKTSKGYDMLKIRTVFKGDYDCVEYAYYILNGKNLATVDTYSFNMKDDESIQKTAEEIANTLEWKEAE